MLMLAACFCTSKGDADAATAELVGTHDFCSANADNHLEVVKCVHQMAIKKGEVAASVYRVEKDIQAAKHMCIMDRPTAMPATTARQPVAGDWVRPKHNPQDHATLCLRLRWKKFEDDGKCGWEMNTEDKAQVLVTDAAGKFRLTNPRSGRESAMTPWKDWRFDDTVFTAIKETVTNLKTDCAKVMFSLYSSQTDIKDISVQIQELHGKDVPKKLQELQDKISVANERLDAVHDLKKRYDQTCR